MKLFHSSLLAFIFKSIKQFRYLVYGLFAVNIVWAIDTSLKPYLLKTIVSKASLTSNKENLWPLLFSMILFFIVSVVRASSSRIYEFVWLNLRPNLQKHIGVKLMNRMMNHSADLYQNYLTGSLVNKINDVISGVPEIISISVNQLFGNILTLIIASYALYTASFEFTIFFLIWALIVIPVSFKLSSIARILSKETAEVKSTLVGYKVDSLSNIAVVKLFGGKEKEMKGVIAKFEKLVTSMQKRDWFFLKINAFQAGSFLLYQGICVCYLLIALQKGKVSAGDFILVLTINISVVDILWDFSYHIRQLAETIGNVEQGLAIVFSPIQIKDKENAKELKVTKGEIAFDLVSFRYKNSTSLFDNLSIKIDPYQKVGLVGYSGSGKSTFINLILRLYNVNSGKIIIDNQNISEVTQHSLRKAIGAIPQESTLFHRSIMENISYGTSKATKKEIIAASKKAHAHEFIMQLPEGYNSLVGERGVKLSGGQRQRIAIARTFLKNPPILILDEASSQLDSITEELIQHSLLKLIENKTTLIVAHRLSTLLHMDRILVFEQGKIVEDGHHKELLALKGLYKTMWDAQVGGFLPEKYK